MGVSLPAGEGAGRLFPDRLPLPVLRDFARGAWRAAPRGLGRFLGGAGGLLAVPRGMVTAEVLTLPSALTKPAQPGCTWHGHSCGAAGLGVGARLSW